MWKVSLCFYKKFSVVSKFGFVCVCESTCICMVILNNILNGASYDCIWSLENMKCFLILFLQSCRVSQQTYSTNMLLVFLHRLVLLGLWPAIWGFFLFCFFFTQQPCLPACAHLLVKATDTISHSLINLEKRRRRRDNCHQTSNNLLWDCVQWIILCTYSQLLFIQWDLI